MIILSFFTNKGVPESGLSPTIQIADAVADIFVVNTTMTALTTITHAYKYDFTTYDATKSYAIFVDGGVTLNNLDRYQDGTNANKEIEADVIILKKILTNRWKIENNQMIFYDSDNTTPLYTFDLKDINGIATNRNVFERMPI